MIKVLLADDHTIVRDGFKRLVEDAGDMQVVAEASDGSQAIAMAHQSLPDVAVLDLSMPGIDGLEVISQLSNYYPDLPVIVLTMHKEEQYVTRALNAGAMGYITKQAAAHHLIAAIRSVLAGDRYLGEYAARSLANRVARKAGASPVELLSNREIQVLSQLASGKTNREIAQTYGISIKTVDTYRSRIFQKLELRNVAELTRFAIKHHLIEP
jgi:DNA-binding NarL/FixJ family response regulator